MIVVRRALSLLFLSTVLATVIPALESRSAIAQVDRSADSYEVFDSFGKHYFKAPPKRVVVTDWTLLEQLLALEVVPIGAPEVDAYRSVMPINELPSTIRDIGLREKPTLAIVGQLKPDLIIVGTDQKQLARPLSRYARVLFYQNFSPRFNNNGSTAIKRLRQLARVFKQEPVAEQVIAQLQGTLEDGRVRIERMNPQPLRVTLLQTYREDSFIRFSPHSLHGWVLGELKVENKTQIPINKFGELRSRTLSADDLLPGQVACFGECLAVADLVDDARARAPARLSPAWPYGGVLTMQRTAEELIEAFSEPDSARP
ncbi:MAG: hypothetical protein AAF756_01865 [Pseudomonadota bacterium]